ncbi:hypothetical protein KP509_16G026800 [Ceratopteris richardii]|uniref:HSF-type DNA-binding domain-containing protein n=1 Tax=Ceratopteris richardii TaxID=49495 RepID=A0A8T2SYZ5_CERRI|nr:hypothetical protein KP509_16G026800 [Ceratopteris richardii]
MASKFTDPAAPLQSRDLQQWRRQPSHRTTQISSPLEPQTTSLTLSKVETMRSDLRLPSPTTSFTAPSVRSQFQSLGQCASARSLARDSDGAAAVPSTPAPFLSKTYDLVDSHDTNSTISWSTEGTSFIVWNPVELCKNLLSCYFKHNNFSSFVRQLNTYGFRKIASSRWEFANESFVKGRKELLRHIHRRKPTAISIAHSHLHPPPRYHHRRVNSPRGSSCSLQFDPSEAVGSNIVDAELDKLQRQKRVLSFEVMKLKERLQMTRLVLTSLERRLHVSANSEQQLLALVAQMMHGSSGRSPVLTEHNYSDKGHGIIGAPEEHLQEQNPNENKKLRATDTVEDPRWGSIRELSHRLADFGNDTFDSFSRPDATEAVSTSQIKRVENMESLLTSQMPATDTCICGTAAETNRLESCSSCLANHEKGHASPSSEQLIFETQLHAKGIPNLSSVTPIPCHQHLLHGEKDDAMDVSGVCNTNVLIDSGIQDLDISSYIANASSWEDLLAGSANPPAASTALPCRQIMPTAKDAGVSLLSHSEVSSTDSDLSWMNLKDL